MARQRRKLQIAPDAQVGCAWYTRAEWERLREIADNRGALDDTFDEWERGALAALAELAAMGRRVRKVPIDVDDLAVWCHQRERRLDGAARAAFVTHLLEQEQRAKL